MSGRRSRNLTVLSLANAAVMMACGPALAAEAAEGTARFLAEQAQRRHGASNGDDGATAAGGGSARASTDIPVETHEEGDRPGETPGGRSIAHFDCPKSPKAGGCETVESTAVYALVSGGAAPRPRGRWAGAQGTEAAAGRPVQRLTGFWATAPPDDAFPGRA